MKFESIKNNMVWLKLQIRTSRQHEKNMIQASSREKSLKRTNRLPKFPISKNMFMISRSWFEKIR